MKVELLWFKQNGRTKALPYSHGHPLGTSKENTSLIQKAAFSISAFPLTICMRTSGPQSTILITDLRPLMRDHFFLSFTTEIPPSTS